MWLFRNLYVHNFKNVLSAITKFRRASLIQFNKFEKVYYFMYSYFIIELFYNYNVFMLFSKINNFKKGFKIHNDKILGNLLHVVLSIFDLIICLNKSIDSILT